jgi:hypothetical protein
MSMSKCAKQAEYEGALELKKEIDGMVQRALEAAGPITINFRPPWNEEERIAVRRMILAAFNDKRAVDCQWPDCGCFPSPKCGAFP